MKIFHLHKETWMPIPIEQAWDFFSLAANLEKITPPDVKYETATPLGDQRLYNGMRISYKLRPLLNIPLAWQTEISQVNAPYKFMDKQIKGPYAFWEHTHTFTQVPGGVKMTDEVAYALPFGWLGIFMHSVIVRKKLEHIFRFREARLRQFFGEYKHTR